MKVSVFGILTEIIGTNILEMNDVIDVEDLKEKLLLQYPALGKQQFFIAINLEKTNNNIKINPTDEIALLPAFAGG